MAVFNNAVFSPLIFKAEGSVFSDSVYKSSVFSTGKVPDTHDGGSSGGSEHWLDYYKRQQEKKKKKLKKQYAKIKNDPVIAGIIAPYIEAANDNNQLPDYSAINIELLFQNKIALENLMKALEANLMAERIARENEAIMIQRKKDEEDENLLIFIAQLI